MRIPISYNIFQECHMIGGGRTVGISMMIIGLVLLVAFTGVVLTSGTTSGGTTLGIFLALIVAAPIFGVGFYVFRKGTTEKAEFAVVTQEKRILNMVLTQG